MALISPGVEVTIIDESQYQPTAVGTVAYILLATQQDKQTPGGGIATATAKANANKLIPITSQRELVSNFGTPVFTTDANDNPIHAHELNEYGLLAAYSALGVANKIYVQRADVNTAELIGTTIRPTGQAVDGTYWLETDTTNWGIYEYTSSGFSLQTPAVILPSDSEFLDNFNVPLDSYGVIGTYVVVASDSKNPVYYKRYDNNWVLVGTDDWMTAVPALVGAVANPVNLQVGNKLGINGEQVAITGTTVQDVAEDINAALINGVTATVSTEGYLELRIDSTSASDGANADGKISITLGSEYGNIDCAANLGLITAADGNITTKTVNGPTVQFSGFRNPPAWRSTDAEPRPHGSIWFKTSATGNGINYNFQQYSALTDSWNTVTAPLYTSDTAAIQDLDPAAGGAGLEIGTLYVKYDEYNLGYATFRPMIKTVFGVLKVTGSILTGANPFTIGHSFDMEVSVPSSTSTITKRITLSGTTSASFVADILAANLPNIVARVEASGAISVSHLAGGTIKWTYVSGTPLVTAGLTKDTDGNLNGVVQEVKSFDGLTTQYFLASPFRTLGGEYIPDTVAPYSDPAAGTLWYHNDPLEVDILINDGSGWKGYKNVSNDARGYDLTLTDPLGPILTASAPTTQVSGAPLVSGDLWIDTGDLENYPVIRRWTDANTWELIDNTDQVSVDGILFADARWGTSGSIDPVVDAYPDIPTLQNSDYIDSDCPDYRLYARGTLLFNTRRSGYGVKRFEPEWFVNDSPQPAVISAWVNNSGQDENQVPYFGHKAQRNVIVEAMRAAIESSVSLREEQTEFNIICCPGYPELITNMITLNNDRKQTAFIIGDSPLTLDSSSASLEAWASNANNAEQNGLNGLTSNSEYLGVYYPSGLATNLDGESVVVPASHMMLRTIIRSDDQSYPWFAPAGVRRGLLDNVSSIGYVDVNDNNDFKSIGVTNNLRDVLYAQRINPLTVLPGVGLVAYGQKTRAAQTSAMDRINVARLTCYLRVVLDKVARPFIFEPNDTITRNQVKAAFESVLNDVVAKRGIYDYLVVCDTSNNTPDRIDRNELWVDIAIEPVKAIEFIYIPVRLKNTGDIAAGL